MKPFNLELAKAGHSVQTKDGKPVRIICFDRKNEIYPIVSLIDFEGCKEVVTHTLSGTLEDGKESELDFVMASEKHEGWINIEGYSCNYDGNKKEVRETSMKIYPTKEEAEANISYSGIVTIKIEWEE